MKGFPNQVADLSKLAAAMRTIADLVDRGMDAKDDGVYGPALVRAGVAGPGHVPKPIDIYLDEQLKKRPSNQSFRTVARGLRELFRLFRLIDDSGARVLITETGRQAADLATKSPEERTKFWRHILRDFRHADATGALSHPYQVLLRLIARQPRISRAKCALALEARDDSSQELDRIVALAEMPEDDIRRRIGVTESNWDNAKKLLPKFAEQLNDVVRTRRGLVLADAPGRSDITVAAPGSRRVTRASEVRAGPRRPRSSRRVTPQTIGQAGTAEGFDEVEMPRDLDPEAARGAIIQRLDRLRRHNLLVQELARRLAASAADLYEDPFDLLALIDGAAILVEVKSLDGSAADERDRVQEALAQLLYYEAFVTSPVAGEASVCKIACFEQPISRAHLDWLNSAGIGSIWQVAGGGFRGDRLAADLLGRYLEEIA